MREIKFRAWDSANAKMIQVKQITEHYLSKETLGYFDYPLMQYTGLKDKNGKEGYDGDLAMLGDSLWQIMWDDSYACWQMKRIDGTHLMPSIPLHNLPKSEIIGNVYSNPELLDKGGLK